MDDNAQNRQDYDSNVRMTDDPMPGGQDDTLPIDHPATDSNIDSHELYDEGIDGAAEAQDSGATRMSDEEARDNKQSY
jgi:hypothetical protein